MKVYLNTLGNEVVEVRAFSAARYIHINSSRKYTNDTIAGWYDDFDKLEEDINALDACQDIDGIYTTIHAIKPELLSRAYNRLDYTPKKTTSDNDVTHFSVFPVDFDTEEGVSGISASAEELAESQERAKVLSEFLDEAGISHIKAMSGNGYHILVLLNPFECTKENVDKFKKVGDSVAEEWGTDKTIYNPARILKLYGTMTRKGDHTEERPHRRSEVWIPDSLERYDFDRIESIFKPFFSEPAEQPLPKAQPTQKTQPAQNTSLKAYLAKHGVEIGEGKAYEGGTKYQIDCPFNPDHKAPDAALYESANGWSFKCSHNSCSSKDWKAFKAHHNIKDTQKQSTPKTTANVSDEDLDAAANEFVPAKTIDGVQVVYTNTLAIQAEGERPLVINRGIDDIATDTWDIILKKNAGNEFIFQNDGIPLQLKKDDLGIKAEALQKESELLAIVNKYVRFAYVKMRVVFGKPVFETMYTEAAPAKLAPQLFMPARMNKLPRLKAIFDHPFFDRINGEYELVWEGGYHPESAVYIDPDKTIEPYIPDELTELSVPFFEVFQDFPYCSESDWMLSTAELVQMLIKPALRGVPMPMHITTAPQHGSGKSMETELILTILLGEKPVSTVLSENTDEIRKSIFTSALEGKEYIYLDNVNHEVDSAFLAQYVTNAFISDRLLGFNKKPTVENVSTLFMTGNNIVLSPEICDRSVIKEIATTKRAAEREFKWDEHSIFEHVKENRRELLSYPITLIQKWIDAECPESEHKHRMQKWCKTVGGIMEVGGLGAHFLKNADAIRIKAAPFETAMGKLYRAIYDEKGEDEWTTADFFEFASYTDENPDNEGVLTEWITAHREGQRRSHFGRIIRKHENVTIGTLKLVYVGQSNRRRTYKIVNVTETEKTLLI